MNREAACETYRKESAVILQDGLKDLEKEYKAQEDRLKKELFAAIREACAQRLLSRPQLSLGYLQLSLLRSRMDEDIYLIMAALYDEHYFLDHSPTMTFIDVSFIFKPLKAIREKLYQTARNYQGKIEAFDADRMIRETAMAFYKKKAEQMRSVFRDFDRLSCIQSLTRCPKLRVQWGEHKEKSETIFLSDCSKKDAQQFLPWNEKNTIHQWNSKFVYQNWDGTRLEDLEVEQKNLLFLGMRDTRLEKCQWERCMLHGASFREAELKQVIFAGCDLSASDFRGVQFLQVKFIQCNLSDADFTGAKLGEVEFTDSKMQNARFSRSALASHALSAAQLQQVCLKEEPYVFYHGTGSENT